MVAIGNVRLSSAAPADTLMPRIGMGTAAYPFDSSDAVRTAILRAIELGYRHLDTAALYQSEEPLGDAIADALRAGLISSRDDLFVTTKLWCSDARDDLFVTTKLWCSDAHAGRVIPALRNSLRNLKLECVDLYLVHWPVSVTPGNFEFPMAKEELMRMDVAAVWAEMEECQRLGLARSIGVSNFSCKKLEALCSFSRIPPAVNQVEVNPLWQQKKLREYCVAKGIQLCAYSPLGAKGTHWGQDWVMNCQVLKDIAAAKGKSLAQICLRWVYEQGDCVLVKSFNEGRMMENLEILDWELSEEETEKIAMIPQCKGFPALDFVSEEGPYKYVQDLWDGEI